MSCFAILAHTLFLLPFPMTENAEVLQRLELPQGQPESFEVLVAYDGRLEALYLEKHSLRSPEMEVLAWSPEEGLIPQELPPVSTYRGHILGSPEIRVTASLLPGGLHATMVPPNGSNWEVIPEGDLHRARETINPFASGACGNEHFTYLNQLQLENDGGGSGRGGADNCTMLAEIAFDADYDFYLQNGLDVNNTILNIENTMNGVDLVYQRDVLISYTITTIIVRTSQFYFPVDAGDLLNLFRDEWNNNQGGIQRDMAHIVTGKNLGAYLGLAWVGVVCNTAWAYGLTVGLAGGWQAIIDHELGHNWACPHWLDRSLCDIMSGNCNQYFGPNNTDLIFLHRDSRTCLDPGTASLDQVPPLARWDRVTHKGATTTFDVLDNDHDANCDTAFIEFFDTTTLQGGAVERSIGTGPNGRDELTYARPLLPHLGRDLFTYTINDGNGNQSTGTVIVNDIKPDLVSHWKLDERVRAKAADSSPVGFDGFYMGGITRKGPPARPETTRSVEFDGIDGRVDIDTLPTVHNMHRNFSVAGWVQPQIDGRVERIISNPGAWGFGLYSGGLRFTTWQVQDYDKVADIPVNVWTHVAAVFKQDLSVVFYVDGQRIGKVNGTRAAPDWTEDWYLATRDNATEFFDGFLDDIQVYDDALSDAQVQWLFDHPGQIICRTDSWNYGTGLAGTAGIPGIASTGSLKIGNQMTIHIDNSLGTDTTGFLMVGLDTLSLPYKGGELLVDPLFFQVVTIPAVGLDVSFTIPDAAVCLPAFFQAAQTDGGAVQGISLTPGLEVRIGN